MKVTHQFTAHNHDQHGPYDCSFSITYEQHVVSDKEINQTINRAIAQCMEYHPGARIVNHSVIHRS